MFFYDLTVICMGFLTKGDLKVPGTLKRSQQVETPENGWLEDYIYIYIRSYWEITRFLVSFWDGLLSGSNY